MNSFKKTIKYVKKHKWASILFEVTIIVLILATFSWYQNRGTLAADGAMAPDFTLQSLTGETIQLSQLKGKKVLIYFFAPWCKICHMSGDNLNALRKARDKEELEILVIGVSYEFEAEVQDFANELQLTVPVLYGNNQIMHDYKIKGFPTYFVIDKDGKVTHRSVGYSTELGMRLRT
ncbi:MAG: TlpA family protein disulfide reductase [Proteobacteria bacterium]|nr:TlpA family protein disulfide reductase [Pseudomonadota bacterium]